MSIANDENIHDFFIFIKITLQNLKNQINMITTIIFKLYKCDKVDMPHLGAPRVNKCTLIPDFRVQNSLAISSRQLRIISAWSFSPAGTERAAPNISSTRWRN